MHYRHLSDQIKCMRNIFASAGSLKLNIFQQQANEPPSALVGATGPCCALLQPKNILTSYLPSSNLFASDGASLKM